MTDIGEARRLPPTWWLPASFTLLLFAFSLLPQFRGSSELSWSLWSACAALVLLQARLLANSVQNGRELKLKISLIPSHYVQAFVQTCIYVYWALYWDPDAPPGGTHPRADRLCLRLRHARQLVETEHLVPGLRAVSDHF